MGGPTTRPAKSGSSGTGAPISASAWRKLDTMPRAESVNVPSRSKITNCGRAVTRTLSPVTVRAAARYHGDQAATPGMLDFAVNVRGAAPPSWLVDRLAARLGDLGRYPSNADEHAATAAGPPPHRRDRQ